MLRLELDAIFPILEKVLGIIFIKTNFLNNGDYDNDQWYHGKKDPTPLK